MSKNNKSKKKLTTLSPKGWLRWHTYLGDREGCGSIRCIIPNLIMNKWKYKGLRFEGTENMNFIDSINFYRNLSWVKFQRSVTPQHEQIIRLCKQIKSQTHIGLLYETDDLLNGDIPETNHAHQYYKTYWENTKNILRMVDGLTVSTEPLKQALLEYNPNIQVITNKLAKWLWPLQNAEEKIDKQHGKIRILWAGSQNHFNIHGEGGDFGKELLNFINKTTDIYEWVLVGAQPNELKNNEKIEFHEWQHIFDFGHYLTSLNCDIGIAPLVQNHFNDCKSNIKMLEYSAMGMPGVYSSCYPYKNALMNCNTEGYLIDRIESLANNKDLRLETYKHDYNEVKDNLYWDDNTLTDYINKHLKLFNKKLG